jgi:type VI protein secretion system component VasF
MNQNDQTTSPANSLLHSENRDLPDNLNENVCAAITVQKPTDQPDTACEVVPHSNKNTFIRNILLRLAVLILALLVVTLIGVSHSGDIQTARLLTNVLALALNDTAFQ